MFCENTVSLVYYFSFYRYEQYKFVKQGDFVYIMKATGIVRRIEEYGIIGQTSRKPHKH